MVAMWVLMVAKWEELMVGRASAVNWRGQAHTAVAVVVHASSLLHAAACSLSRPQAFGLKFIFWGKLSVGYDTKVL